jgi:glycosyltransferase involved in cell wall biosynthesis
MDVVTNQASLLEETRVDQALATKKILLLIGTGANRIGGVEVLLRETAVQLIERGVETIAAFHSEPSPAVRRYFDVPGLTVVSLPDLTDRTWHKNVGVRSLLKKYRPDIVHWQYLDALSPYPWLSWWYGAKQVFFTNQSSYAEGYTPTSPPIWKRISARLINWHLTGVFCNSDFLKRASIASRKVPESRIHRIYNAVSLPLLEGTAERSQAFRRKYGIPEQAPVILQVSWLIPEKGIEDLLRAAKLVLARYPEAWFVIGGEGSEHARLEKLAQDLGIAGSVVWTGFLESPTETGLFDAADIVCQLSRWEEAFGYVIAEGMSFAKPVVATRVGGIVEVVTDEKTGLLSPRRDPEAAAQNICRLLADPALRRKFGEAGRRKVEEMFSVEDRVTEMLAYYDIPPAKKTDRAAAPKERG